MLTRVMLSVGDIVKWKGSPRVVQSFSNKALSIDIKTQTNVFIRVSYQEGLVDGWLSTSPVWDFSEIKPISSQDLVIMKIKQMRVMRKAKGYAY